MKERSKRVNVWASFKTHSLGTERSRPLLKRGLSLFLRVELGCSTLRKNVSLKGNLTAPGPQKNVFFGPGVLPQAFFFVKNMFLVLVRCRRRLFFVKEWVFGPGTLQQAPFFVKKCVFGPGTLPRALFLDGKSCVGRGTLPQAPFPNIFLHFPGPLPILGQLSYDIIRLTEIMKRHFKRPQNSENVAYTKVD